ncbi:hypothetical protein MPTK2_4g18790 [Marchantia polymorpha subsp. ruderalis]
MEWRKLLFWACLLLLQVAMGKFAHAFLQEDGSWDHLEPTRKCLIPLCCCKKTWWCPFKHTCFC